MLLSYRSSQFGMAIAAMPLLFAGCADSNGARTARADAIRVGDTRRLPSPTIHKDPAYVEAARLYRAGRLKAAEDKVAALLIRPNLSPADRHFLVQAKAHIRRAAGNPSESENRTPRPQHGEDRIRQPTTMATVMVSRSSLKTRT